MRLFINEVVHINGALYKTLKYKSECKNCSFFTKHYGCFQIKINPIKYNCLDIIYKEISK